MATPSISGNVLVIWSVPPAGEEPKPVAGYSLDKMEEADASVRYRNAEAERLGIVTRYRLTENGVPVP